MQRVAKKLTEPKAGKTGLLLAMVRSLAAIDAWRSFSRTLRHFQTDAWPRYLRREIHASLVMAISKWQKICSHDAGCLEADLSQQDHHLLCCQLQRVESAEMAHR
jgi:hypothetical protein